MGDGSEVLISGHSFIRNPMTVLADSQGTEKPPGHPRIFVDDMRVRARMPGAHKKSGHWGRFLRNFYS